MSPRSNRALVEVAGTAAGMVLFALFVHQRGPLLLPSLVGVAVVWWSLHRALAEESPRALFGITVSWRAAGLCLPGLLLGLGLAIAYRRHLGVAGWPGSLTRFAVIAALIGTVEELVYRGYLQSRLRGLGAPAAVISASLLHTAYKCALFTPGLSPWPMDLPLLAVATFAGGIGFGALREVGRSVLPAVMAHAVFDVIVYGDAQEAPWWIWS